MFKCILLGESGVGKSCLVRRLIDNQFEPTHDFTIGVEFSAQTVTIEGQTIRLQIWDTAGQEKFQAITRAYYRKVAIAILVYDVNNRSSFNHISKWLKDIKLENADHSPTIILVGNKTDLAWKRQVTTQEGQDYAQKHGLLFWETSAKNHDPQVREMFQSAATDVYHKISLCLIDPRNEVTGVRGSSLLNLETRSSGLDMERNPDHTTSKCCWWI